MKNAIDATYTTETTDPRIKIKIGTRVHSCWGLGTVVGFYLPDRKDYSERYAVKLDDPSRFIFEDNPFFLAREIKEVGKGE